MVWIDGDVWSDDLFQSLRGGSCQFIIAFMKLNHDDDDDDDELNVTVRWKPILGNSASRTFKDHEQTVNKNTYICYAFTHAHTHAHAYTYA